ncbi:prolyl-tRNA synthetase [bacterium]|nr:MAG: prolyl-tRNA synthetase [bacterium]
MRVSQLFTKTSKNLPADETAKNAQLLIQAGYIHKEMAGVYTFLPLGLRVLENIKRVVREEMNAVGGQEVQMTVLQPRELFEKTDRWSDDKVDNWFKTKLVNGTELGMGLTHEEPIVDMLSSYINSYRDLPVLVYQIQTKFRNELRAQAGLLRGREFMMKDMYSFARNQEEHAAIYERVAEAYISVYERLGIGDITYRTYADGGIFTPRFSDEFQMLSDIGEDTIYIDEARKIAVNKEVIDDARLADTDIDKDKLVERRAIEVGNIFPLESKYTDALGVFYTDAGGKQQKLIAGCYGIGVSRLVGALAEHFSDEKGLIWPAEVAPFRYYLVVLGSEDAVVAAQKLYKSLGEDAVLFDDRMDVSAGAKFADAELLGCPIRLVVSDKTLATNEAEVKSRSDKFSEHQIKLEDYDRLTKLTA